jgi:ATP-binding cassette, subfamily B, bacterial
LPTTETPALSTVVRDGSRLIARFVRARPAAFAFAVSGGALFASAIVASAIVIGRVTDDLILPVLDRGAPTSDRLLPAVLAIVAVAVWKAAGITLRRTAAGWLQFRSQADLRGHLIEHQLGLELSWYSRQSTGNLLSVSDTDAAQSTFILAPLPYGTAATLLLVGTIVIISVIDPILGALAFVSLGLVAAINLYGSWRTYEAFEEVQVRRGAVGSVAHESFDGALTVKALGREDVETERMRVASEGLRDELTRVGRIWGTYRSIVDALPPATTVALVVVGALRIDAGAITPGDVVTVAYMVSLLGIPVRLIGFVLWDLTASLASWRRVTGVLDADERVRHGDLPARSDRSGAGVIGDGVGFAYPGDTPLLAGVRLDIPPGRTVALVGPTASGKSTLAMLMARLWDPDDGSIRLDGRDLRDFAPAALAAEVAFVPQEAFLFDDTVRGNVTLGFPYTDTDVDAALSLAGAAGFVADLPAGASTRIGERGTSLSGGQRQRIALARALVRRPRLLILDDATSAVDPSVEAAILRGLRAADLPSTVIVVAYRRSSITLADEVVFLDGGRIVDAGSHEELLAREPGYARLLRAYEDDADRRARPDEPR